MFRGEALGSIAAVSQVELRTRQAEDEIGTITYINGGKFEDQKPDMSPVGSQFCVRNLFYNVPVRRKFLDKSSTSSEQIKEEFRRVALCNPDIEFKLYSNDAIVYNLPATNLRGRVVDVVGKIIEAKRRFSNKNIGTELLDVAVETTVVKIEGFVGIPAAAKKRGSNLKQYMFVNGRYFKSQYLMSAVQRAYAKLVPEGLQVDCFLSFTVAPDRVDVNIHPQKTEVKFEDNETIWQILNATVRESLAKTGAVPSLDFEDSLQTQIPVAQQGVVYREPPVSSREDYNPFSEDYVERGTGVKKSGGFASTYKTDRVSDVGRDYEVVSEGLSFDVGSDEFEIITEEQAQQQTISGFDEQLSFSDMMLIGANRCVAMYGGHLVVVDMNRVRERVVFESIVKSLQAGQAVGQKLLFPQRLVLSSDEAQLLRREVADFTALGFEVEFVDELAVDITAAPAEIDPDEIDQTLFELLGVLTSEGEDSVGEMHRERIATVMARNAAKRRMILTKDEVGQLLSTLVQIGNVSFTPSGKPVMFELTVEEIAKRLN